MGYLSSRTATAGAMGGFSAAGESVTAALRLSDYGGLLEVSFQRQQQAFSLVPSPKHFGGLQWYGVRPKNRRWVWVLYRLLGVTYFASRHAWGHRAA